MLTGIPLFLVGDFLLNSKIVMFLVDLCTKPIYVFFLNTGNTRGRHILSRRVYIYIYISHGAWPVSGPQQALSSEKKARSCLQIVVERFTVGGY